MDTNKASVDQFGVSGNISSKKVNNLDKTSAVMETDDSVLLLSSPTMVKNGEFDLIPITPDSNKESLDLISGFTSPLTLVSSPLMNGNDDSPSTPKDGVFDPFAPGPDNLMLAPVSMKCGLEESRNFVARKLNFNSFITKNDCEKRVSESCFEDDMLLEAVYDSLLEIIICQQAEDMVAEISTDDFDSSPDAVKTPPFAPRLTGIADTCPGAPLKLVKKSRNIDLGLCRKLEFEF